MHRLFLLLLLPGTFAEVQHLPLADCDDVAWGPRGDLFLACHSPGDRFPQGAVKTYGPGGGGMEAYVLRWNPQAKKLIYATRIGGSGYDAAHRLIVDANGVATVTGVTRSPDFLPELAGDPEGDAFVLQLSPQG